MSKHLGDQDPKTQQRKRCLYSTCWRWVQNAFCCTPCKRAHMHSTDIESQGGHSVACNLRQDAMKR
jgi:hypothetical protein